MFYKLLFTGILATSLVLAQGRGGGGMGGGGDEGSGMGGGSRGTTDFWSFCTAAAGGLRSTSNSMGCGRPPISPCAVRTSPVRNWPRSSG